MDKKGIALILGFAVIMILAILGSAIISRSIHENQTAKRYAESTQAFWLAEAGVNRALRELKEDFSYLVPLTGGADNGAYSVTIGNVIDSEHKKVTARGFIPSTGTARAERIIEAIIYSGIPANFYNNAVYTPGTVDINGNAFFVSDGDYLRGCTPCSPAPCDPKSECMETCYCVDEPPVAPCVPISDCPTKCYCSEAITYGTNFDVQQPDGNIHGTYTQDFDLAENGLTNLDYGLLHDISTSQQNVYIKSGNKLINEATGVEGFPTDFWYNDGIDNDGDGTTDEADDGGPPNVVYVEADLTLKGGIGTIGGFYVVVGDVITNPSGTYDATINGNGQIDGIIYTRGTFSINGGGGNGLNVDGGVWAGEEVELNGSANITYNKTYMDALKNSDFIESAPQITSWRETQGPYKLE